MKKGLNIFGIGVGISPFEIENIFPNIIYSLNPDKLFHGIASCSSGTFPNNATMKIKVPGTKLNLMIQILKIPKKTHNIKN